RSADEDEFRFSPIDARRAIALLPRLPRSFGVAGTLDGRREGSSARQTTRRILHTLPPSPGRVRPVEKNHPKPRRQYMAARRRNHSRRERRASSEEGCRRTTRSQRNPRRRRPANSQRLGGRTALLRLYLSEVPRFLTQSQR